jgi:hypothetical protein
MKITSHESGNGHRAYELEGRNIQIMDVIDFLLREDLPEVMSLCWDGRIYVFRSRGERLQFAFGLQHAFETLH